jgi:hypothetical protein
MTRFILVAVALLALACAAHAVTDTTSQTLTLSVNNVAKISLAKALDATAITAPIALTITNPDAGGDIPKAATDSSTALRYTSIIDAVNGSSNPKRSITAAAVGNEPGGCDLLLSASTAAANTGVLGSGLAIDLTQATGPNAPLWAAAQNIVSGIQNGYTGITAGKGSILTFTLQVNSDKILQLRSNPGSTNTTVTYTMLDAS